MNLFDKISDFKLYLESEEKSLATIEKYTRDVSAFCRYISDICLHARFMPLNMT